METKAVGDVVYTLNRRESPENDLGNWYWLGADGSVLEPTEAELRALKISDDVLDDRIPD
ncbi:MAG: hypothetical protein D3X82_02815 [Candidatus Leucobacter sulfamidivorax]|nr:hypothetical protein [Candidatus Leucobacter sulfamidivorax]